MKQDDLNQKYINTSLTKDQQMFIYRWYPILGGLYCSKELGVKSGVVRNFATESGIPTMITDYEYSITEIANRLGMTEVEVQTIFNAGMRKLREAFKQRMKDE